MTLVVVVLAARFQKKRAVTKRTVKEWISQHDRKLNTALWLKFDMANRLQVYMQSLHCSVCTQFKGMRNFRSAFIDGSTNVRVSCVKYQ